MEHVVDALLDIEDDDLAAHILMHAPKPQLWQDYHQRRGNLRLDPRKSSFLNAEEFSRFLYRQKNPEAMRVFFLYIEELLRAVKQLDTAAGEDCRQKLQQGVAKSYFFFNQLSKKKTWPNCTLITAACAPDCPTGTV
ncbi:MAG: hypothetical protein A2087_11150 [Spirochaetes bacterium GWD1_61_31]|nr:MAG: hypothetical protein A2Y37_09900 [Spirochaetes bacterium GWB1_60_80]OHD34351.1 MAG: hypothetical protein A2004_07815 [Spirochaetes bacterium GWC1_61_12]OHD43132.1 MAG: hypothetical protein A2087_11150 [Spirochaetes bacterium GWD1_61_31]OHD44266.1 MAG: hypothetical protein A2Y35_06945 [Spirochaetes bacterium GWE1_60_18]OHD60374.1 MAG: hypothetical protein A2Y32_00580 [Spirochaetes bacterium GWF1_60_12]HAW86985.1 hypothetical protein [Spirochaetaceae bacterium]